MPGSREVDKFIFLYPFLPAEYIQLLILLELFNIIVIMEHMEINVKCYITRNKFNNSVNTWQTSTISPTLEKANAVYHTDDIMLS